MSRMRNGGGNQHDNSSVDLSDDDVRRAASIPADVPPPLRCSVCPGLLRSRKICPGRRTNIREQCIAV